MLSDFEFKEIGPNTIPLLVPLMQDAFGHRDVEAGYFHWKYIDNPAGPAIGYLAVDRKTGEAASYYGMIPEDYRMNGKRSVIHQSCDTMTHSRYRRRGLFAELSAMTYANAVANNDAFAGFGFSAEKIARGFARLGWKIPFEIPHYFMPSIQCRALLALSRLRRRPPARALIIPDLNDDFIDLVQRSANEQANGKILDEPFIRWRLANPRRRYHLALDPSGACAVFSLRDGFLFLFHFYETLPGAGRMIMDVLMEQALKFRGKGILTFSQRGIAYERMLKRYHFLRNDFGWGPGSGRISFLTYDGNVRQPWLHNAESWQLTPFDHDSA